MVLTRLDWTLLDHQRVVVLEHPGLGTHLQGDHPGQFQVVEFLFKAVAQADHVVVGLGIGLGAAGLGLLLQLGQVLCLDLGQPLFPARMYMVSSCWYLALSSNIWSRLATSFIRVI